MHENGCRSPSKKIMENIDCVVENFGIFFGNLARKKVVFKYKSINTYKVSIRVAERYPITTKLLKIVLFPNTNSNIDYYVPRFKVQKKGQELFHYHLHKILSCRETMAAVRSNNLYVFFP